MRILSGPFAAHVVINPRVLEIAGVVAGVVSDQSEPFFNLDASELQGGQGKGQGAKSCKCCKLR